MCVDPMVHPRPLTPTPTPHPHPASRRLLARYERGETKGLLVFVGHLEPAGDGCVVRLGVKTPPSTTFHHPDLTSSQACPRWSRVCYGLFILSVTVAGLPKMKSANVTIHLTRSGGVGRVAYSPPVAPIQAFHAALALIHYVTVTAAHWRHGGEELL